MHLSLLFLLPLACGPVGSSSDSVENRESAPAWPTSWEYRGLCIRDTEYQCVDGRQDFEDYGVLVVDCLEEDDFGEFYECAFDGLDDAGRSGWELVGVSGDGDYLLESGVVYVMKRALFE